MKRLAVLILVLVAAPADAAQIIAEADVDVLRPEEVGRTMHVVLVLELEGDEVASVFEGAFAVSGASVIPFPNPDVYFPEDPRVVGGSTWPNAAGNVVGSQVLLSLTSNNRGGTRELVFLSLTWEAVDTLQITLNPGWILQRDIPAFPYFEDVPLEVPEGGTLLTLEPIPEPMTLALSLVDLIRDDDLVGRSTAL